jgi:hypothetical protein
MSLRTFVARVSNPCFDAENTGWKPVPRIEHAGRTLEFLYPSHPMSDIDLAVSSSKRLESLLETKFGASGRGLHEKVSSVERDLPHDLVRKIRLVATVRNKIVHESNYQNIDHRKEFIATCKQAERELKALGGGGARAKPILIAIAVVIVIVVVIVLKIATKR